MAQLPRYDPAEVATESDLAALESDFVGLRSDFGELRSGFAEPRSDTRLDISELRGELSCGPAAVNHHSQHPHEHCQEETMQPLDAMVGVTLGVA